MTDALHYLGGRFVSALNPTGEVVVRSPADLSDVVASVGTSAALVDDALGHAARAKAPWRRASFDARCAMLRRYQDAMRARAEDLASAISREIGKPRWEARTEVQAMIAKVDVTLGEAMRFTETERLDTLPGEISHRPHGVLAVVGPFNFPGHLPNGQFVPALALGNVVVFKPSEKAPLTAKLVAECMHAAGVPEGVFQVLQGGRDIAEYLVSHEALDGIFFTGSTAVGEKILAANAHRPGRLVALELGGKNASLVFGDADLERAAREIAFSAFATAGQRCTASSRLYVVHTHANELADRLARAANGAKTGHFDDPSVFLGPMISAPSRDALFAAQALAERRGVDRIAGGGIADVPGFDGHYVRPAVHRAKDANVVVPGFTDVELFGPDITIYPVDSEEEAVARANDSRFGLVTAVFTQSAERFRAAAAELEVGVVHWNRSSAGASGRLPFGGLRASGNHRPAGILAGAQTVAPVGVYLSPAGGAPLPSWPGLSFE
jgi:succinylglutamate-semialdehyde dehydrogenase